MPARKDALSAYHIIRLPAPLTGGLPGEAGKTAAAVNNTLLSATWSRVTGVEIPIPTF
nr:hypothetical protein [Candidatus Brachybacter algidus]